MKTASHTGLTLAAALLVAGSALAGTGLSTAQLRYQQERAACLNGSSNQDRATCLKEAGAALQEARRDGLATDEARLAQNRLNRCMTLPAQDREECIARIEQGATSGSAREGGILRQLERPAAAR
jgi:hypothetical protein